MFIDNENGGRLWATFQASSGFGEICYDPQEVYDTDQYGSTFPATLGQASNQSPC
jgi:hypothetical protein